MMKISALPCGNLCFCIVKQSKMKRLVGLLVSRTYSTSATGRMPLMSKTHIQYKKNAAPSYSVLELFKRHSERYFSVKVSAENVRDKADHCTSSMDIKVLVDELVERSLDRDRMIAVLPKSELHEHITTLVEAGLQKSDILNLHKYPELIKKLGPLTETITFFLEYGIPKENISNIVNNCPKALHKTKTEISSRIEKLHALGFTSHLIIKMICNYPAILDNDLSLIPQRIEDLKTLFKTKDTYKFLEKSPDLLFCDYNHIVQRFNYVYTVMGITQPQMRHSNLFSYPLEHIHARHMFVERAGFFKVFARKKGQIDTNPSLDTIIDTSDEEFVNKFGNMSVKDYHTFKKLLKKDRVLSAELEEYLDE